MAAQDQLSDWGNDNSLAIVHKIYSWPKNSPVPQPENHCITTHEIVSAHVDIAPREEQQTIACILPVSALGEKEQNKPVHYSWHMHAWDSSWRYLNKLQSQVPHSTLIGSCVTLPREAGHHRSLAGELGAPGVACGNTLPRCWAPVPGLYPVAFACVMGRLIKNFPAKCWMVKISYMCFMWKKKKKEKRIRLEAWLLSRPMWWHGSW